MVSLESLTSDEVSNGAISLDMLHPAPKAVKAASNCDGAYPDFCIPSAPLDSNCKDFSQKNFRVLQPDPHKLDRDKEGIGGESRR